jgi:hypothetical protein
MKLIGSGDENYVMISSVPKRRVLFHACFLSFQPKSVAVSVISTVTLDLQECGRVEMVFFKEM